MLRISTAAICVAILATSPLDGASEEKRIEDRLARAKSRVDDVMLKTYDAKELVKRSRIYIARAETALANRHTSFAAPLSEAADALSRAVDHVVRSGDVTRTDYPTRNRLQNHLDSIVLRVQQASYFQRLGGDSSAKALVGLAQRYKDRARDAYKQGKRRETAEFATAADEIVRALEYIAYAQTSSGSARRG